MVDHLVSKMRCNVTSTRKSSRILLICFEIFLDFFAGYLIWVENRIKMSPLREIVHQGRAPSTDWPDGGGGGLRREPVSAKGVHVIPPFCQIT